MPVAITYAAGVLAGWRFSLSLSILFVAVVTPGVLSSNFFTGRTVELTGILPSPPGPPAEGLFDYRAFLAWQGIYFQLHCADTNDWRLIATANSEAPADRPFPRVVAAHARARIACRGRGVAPALGHDSGLEDCAYG